jgi:hypothetical protein
LEQPRVAINAAQRHVSEKSWNAQNHVQHVVVASVGEFAEKIITARNPTQKPTSSQISHYYWLSHIVAN